MTIKKRLFISNILMTVIPYLISMATILTSLHIINLLTDYEYGRPLVGRGFAAAYSGERGVQAVLIMLALLFFFGMVMILTNRFLTRHVFKKIEQPLELLSGGVKHISDGNLDFRIEYSEQDEFRPVCKAFNNMAMDLKELLETVKKNEQSRKELIAGISHDLRSPLTSIKAFTEGLIDGVAKTPESQQKYLKTIKQKTEDINNIVSQLFLYSKMDIGSYPTYPEYLDIGMEISEYVAASAEEYSSKGLAIKVAGLTTGVNIYADPLQLRSVFANILDNSAKYKINEIVITRITCMCVDKSVVIVFEDNGPGVPKDAMPHLFEIFYRTDPSRRNPNQGSGLGLAIVSKAIECMGGCIEAENAKDGGLRMIITIPEISMEEALRKESKRHEKNFDN